MSNEPDEVNSGALGTIVVVLAISVLAIALVVTSLVRDEEGRLRAQTSGENVHALQAVVRDLKMAQLSELSAAPRWVAREKGVVSVPIARASELVLEAVRTNPYALSPGNDPAQLELEAAARKEGAVGTAAVAGAEAAPGAEAMAPSTLVPADKPLAGDPTRKLEAPQVKSPAPNQAPALNKAPASPATQPVAPVPAAAAPGAPTRP